LKDPLGQHVSQWLVFHARQCNAQYVGRVTVGESSAWLMGQWESRDLSQPAVLILSERQLPVGRSEFAGEGEPVAESAAVGHQIVEGDGSLQRFGVVQRAARGSQHPRRRQLGQPLHHRVVQRQPAFVDEHHGGGDGDGFGHRGDAEQGVALHRQLGFDVAVAELVDLQDLAVAPNERHDAGQEAGVDRVADGGLVTVEIHPRQANRSQASREGPGPDLVAV
jgi:hypothetical protein